MSTRAARPSASQCEVCRRWAEGALCRDCIDRWAAPVARCDGCGLRLSTAATRCGACLRDPPPFERCRCAVDYTFPWDGLIAAFKYHGRVELAASLAACVLEALDRDDRAWPDLLLPVPLAPARLAERGYNQAWELARRLAARVDRPARAGLLRRPLSGPRQTLLDRQARRRNLRGCFEVVDPQALAGRRLVLVDDVLTTGATAIEATLTLMHAGAAAVQVWALARTP